MYCKAVCIVLASAMAPNADLSLYSLLLNTDLASVFPNTYLQSNYGLIRFGTKSVLDCTSNLSVLDPD